MSYRHTVLVTGGTMNLGYYAALDIAKSAPDTLVVISARSDREHAASTINKTLNQENVVFLPLDLSSIQNVRDFATQWPTHQYPPIRAMVLNAGLQFPGGLHKTQDGIESTFAVCHVGHALLFHLLCQYLEPRARIVVTSSGVHDPAQKTGMPKAVYTTAEELAHPSAATVNVPGRQRYTSSKLVNVLWTYALDKRLKQRAPQRGITVTAFDPGLMPGTGLARDASALERFLWKHVMPRIMPLLRLFLSPNIHTARESGAALARLAVAQDVEGVSGKYFEGRREIRSSKDSYDEAKQDDLWEWTVKYLAAGDKATEKQFEEFR